MRIRSFVAPACSLALSLVIAAASAHADPTGSDPPSAAPVLRIVNGRRVWVLPETHIHGERQAPYVFDVPGRSATVYAPTDAPRSDANRVVEAVRRAPF